MGDYLWDRTGAPDPEVEKLEELLGSLAHRPRSLELPPEAEARPRRVARVASLAAAAALLVAALGGALVAYRLSRPGVAPLAESGAPREQSSPREAAPPREVLATPPVEPERAAHKDERRVVRAAGTAYAPRRARRVRAAVKADPARGVEVAAAPRAEAERLQVKNQLVYALRLTSAKLGEVRRRVQGEDERGTAPEGRGRTR